MSRAFTAQQLLELGLPALPTDKGSLSRLIDREGWRTSPLARKTDRGWEYDLSLLPIEAQAAILEKETPRSGTSEPASKVAWERFERLPEKAKAAARERLQFVDLVDGLRAGGGKAAPAVSIVARSAGVSESTLWSWLKLCDGLGKADRLAALAPQHKGRTSTVECDPRAWDFFVADYLRPEKPSFTACYRRLEEAAREHDWSPVPALKTLQRRLERTFPAPAIALKRDGRDAVARMFPHQRRDRSGFSAMQAVNADGHKFDVFVRWEDGTIGRPILIGIQDLATGMVVGHRLSRTENWSGVRLAFADAIQRYGIPEDCYLDNGRAFASKELTGGMPNRFRFKVREEEPAGILTQLGIRVHWTTPYHGQAKPIERAWRDLAEEVSKHPRCAGAYTGNKPDAKPENYASAAVPISQFREIVASEIERHNRRRGRRGMCLNGESFADAFERSLQTSVVMRATAAQRRLLLTAAEGVTCERRTGEIGLFKNRYWAPELTEFRGQKVVVRFDPDNLHQPMGVYERDGRLICEARLIADTGFADSSAAQDYGRQKRQYIKAHRDLADMEQRLGIAEVAQLLPRLEPAPAAPAPVIRLVTDVPPSGAAEQASADANFARAIRALADQSESAAIIPLRKAEAG